MSSPSRFATEHFLFPAGLWALLALIPFIIFYLIRPRPKHEAIPSLMFILKDMGKTNVNAFLRNFLRDILFFLQLFVILLLALAAAKPFVEVPKVSLAQETVVVLDVSASMQAGDRFERAKDAVLDTLGKENTVIVVKNVAELVMEEGDETSAKELIRSLEPVETTTNLYDALILAGDFVGESSRVVVASDFVNTAGGANFETALQAIRSKGAVVELIDVWEPVENVGIIDLDVREDESTVWVKNYNDRPERVVLRVSNTSEELLLGPHATELVKFPTPNGVNEVVLEADDGFVVDNKAYVSTPVERTVRALMITNNPQAKQGFLQLAFDLIGEKTATKIVLDYVEPPSTTDLSQYSLFIIKDVDVSLLLPSVVKEIGRLVREEGAALVVMPQEGLFAIDFGNLLPVRFVAEGESRLNVELPIKSLLTEDIEFGQASKYFKTSALPGVTVLARGDDDVQTPMVALKKVGAGYVLYYGFFDGFSTFPLDNTYPVFWKRMVDFLTNKPDVNTLNYPTGTQLSFDKLVRVRLPKGGVVETNFISLDNEGLYEFPDRVIAATLRSDRESSVFTRDEEAGKERLGSGEVKKQPLELTPWFIVAALLLLFLELVYIKFRGDC